jgi:hypothetical protein
MRARIPRGLLRVVAARVGGGVVAAQAAGVLVLVVATLAERGAGDVLAELAARVPPAASLAAGALTLLGAALAVARARDDGTARGLAACGVSPLIFVVTASLFGGAVGAGAAVAGADSESAPPPGAFARGEGGWWRDGASFPDVPGTAVGAPPTPGGPDGAIVLTGLAAGAAGAALGLRRARGGALGAAALLVVVEAACRGLVDRGAASPVVAGLPAVIALLGALATLRGPPRRAP